MRIQRRSLDKKWLLLVSVGVCFAVAAATFLLTRSDDDIVPANDVVARVVTYSTDTPDETKPDDDFEWKGSADDPKKIIIPSLGIDDFIQNVGVDQKNEIAVPDNIHMAGWFVESVRPGDKGLSIIDGHLNGPQADGIFINLENIQPNEKFEIEFGNGTARTFAVKSIRTVDLEAAADVLYSQDPNISNQLQLITCGGDFDRDARLYDKRVIVTAEFIAGS